MLTPGSLAIAACLAALVWAPPALADPITSLGTLGGYFSYARAINDSGQIVGDSSTIASSDDIFSYTTLGGMVDLGLLGGNLGPNGVATAINGAGQIVGYAWAKNGEGFHAFLYSNGVFTDLGTLGGPDSFAYGINSSGQIVGYSYLVDGSEHAFSYTKSGGMTDLGTLGGADSAAVGINDSGEIVGSSEVSGGNTHAFSYTTADGLVDLGTLGGANSAAIAINATGQIAGSADTAGGAAHAFLISGGPMADLGTLGGTNSTAVAINAAGQIVGYSDTGSGSDAFLYSSGIMVDLNTLLPVDSGWFLIAAYDINDYGQAVGYGQQSGAPDVAFRLDTEPPVITELSPGWATAGQAGFTLTVTGTNFFPGAVVLWNGTPLTTTPSSPGTLTVTIPASYVATATTASVTVDSAGTSDPVTFTIYPPPSISLLSPNSAHENGSGFNMTVTGANFFSGATVYWGATALTTTYNDSNHLTAAVTSSQLLTAGTVNVTVKLNGVASNALPFTIIPPPPTITSLNPSSAAAAGPAFTLTINGTNYVTGAVAYWNATALTTTYVSGTQITAAVPASLIAGVGSATITVMTSGGTSGGATFTIKPQPVLISISPSSAVAGGPAFTLTATGSNFLPSAKVRWNGTALTTTYVSSTTLTAAVPAPDIATAGTASVTVKLLGATSAAVTFTITSPLGTITLTPSSLLAGGPGFILQVGGSGFHSGATIYWGTTALATTFVGSGQLLATVPASLIATPGTVGVTVEQLGVYSAAATFTILAPAATLTSLSPNSALHGAAGFTLTINGSGFASGAVAKWGATALATTFVSAGKLTASVSSSDIATATSVSVTVVNPGANASNALTFTVH
ncbi:MAG: IPT/TIG domain-containing protein [Bryobacteraceae bacterium]